MSRECRALSKLHRAYLLAPKVILYGDDPSILDALFYLMQPIRGVILCRQLPPGFSLSPDVAPRLSEVFLDNLVRLHGLGYVAVGLGNVGKPQGYLQRQVKVRIERDHNSTTHDLPEIGTPLRRV
jgi:aminoglycoside phosphotransferase (APT) family kinase protein